MPLHMANLSSQGIEVLPHGAVKIPGVTFDYHYAACDISSADTYKLEYLRERWNYLNKHLFGGVMKEPEFVISRKVKTLGVWYKYTKTMEFGKRMFKQPQEYDLLGTLVHEMAHQYDSDVLHTPRDPNDKTKGHGASWQHIMQSIGMTTDAKYSGPALKTVVQRERESELRERLKNNQRVGFDKFIPNSLQNDRITGDYRVFRYVNPDKGKDHPIVVDPYKGFGFMNGWEVKKDGSLSPLRSTFNPDYVVVPGPLKVKTALYKQAQAHADKMNALG